MADDLLSNKRQRRGPPKGYIEAIEGRLHRLEALLGSTIQEDDPRSQAILAELNAPLETAYGELVRPRPMRRTAISGFEGECGSLEAAESAMSSGRDDPPGSSRYPPGSLDSVNDNHGSLSIDESGQLRYYGKSSGFYMLRSNKNFPNGSFHFHTGASKDGQTAAVNPFEMPPEDLSEQLLDIYFNNFYPFLPLLHKKSFLAALNSNRPPPPLLLNAIYAVASRLSNDVRVRKDPEQHDTAGDVFFERARLLLDYEWDNFRVSTVQALLLMSSHQNGALKTIRGWLYSGMAFRMSQNLGLHRNCDDWELSAVEKEERKRAFYCCFVVDRMTCAMHGRSPMIDERDYDTPYPSEHDDDDLDSSPRIMENFHYLIKLCEILGDVLRDLYMVKSRKQLSMMTSPDSVISVLDKALNKWMAKLPPALQYRPPNTRIAEQAPAPALQLCQLHMLFYTTLILLHRPFIPGPEQTTSPSVFPSSSICTFAANKILDIAGSLMAERRLKNVNNYSLYFMFTAGIIFIYNAASSDSMFSFEARISINKIMHAMDEVELTWRTSARHCNILGALAGLRDINLESIDDSHKKLSKLKPDPALPPPSIAVPNSPEPLEEQELTNDRKMEERFSEYYQSSSGNGYDTSPELSNNHTMTPQSHIDSSHSISSFSTPEIAPGNRMFDAATTAFWGMPMSFDIDEWNTYLSTQTGEPQKLIYSQPDQRVASQVPQTGPPPSYTY
ncbi:hypothetical protein DFQ28_000006 [Apophysomyces sp. BC1034]|nr:hypothetical protein DFQ29_002178 [Apophysomyces sp. BC1021]KAG0194907.1 hypothetical protein DFQ28_000006 [Apophysomyces sp. BC1034]